MDTRAYLAFDIKEMLKQRTNGKKLQYIYPAESYKETAILEMLNNGVNVLYLRKPTGLDIKLLLSNLILKSRVILLILSLAILIMV